MRNTYQNSSMIEANNSSDAPTYWSVWYLCMSCDVWYKILAPARTTIPTENANPKLKPNNAPTTIKPSDIKPPTIIPVLKNEKSFFDKKATAVNPLNKNNVIRAAWVKISKPPPEKNIAI